MKGKGAKRRSISGILAGLVLISTVLFSWAAQAGGLPELKAAAPPGPICYPLAYMAEHNTLSEVTDKLSIKPWRTYDQLMAMVAAKEVALAGSPVTNAIMMYNKGLPIRLINVGLWGMLYIISADDSIQSLADLKGKTVSVNSRGGNHDLVFRHLLIQNGLTPDQDVDIIYLALPEASAKLAAGDISHAVMNEPRASIGIMNAKKAGKTLYRKIDLQQEWAQLTGAEAKIPQAGFIAIDETSLTLPIIEAFNEKYFEASQWINTHPAQAGPLVEKYFSFMKAKAVQVSLKFARLEAMSAADSRAHVDSFYRELFKTAPAKAFGGKLPDEGFFYKK